MKTFILQHVSSIEDTKFIGVFSSIEQCHKVIAKLSKLPGFKENPDLITGEDERNAGFFIGEYVVDDVSWDTGFETRAGRDLPPAPFEIPKKKKKKKAKKIKRGSVVVFEPSNFNPEFWNNLSEEDRIKHYGELGYGQEKKKLFVFLSCIRDAEYDTGHCVLVSLDDQKILTMRHTSDFRVANEDEF